MKQTILILLTISIIACGEEKPNTSAVAAFTCNNNTPQLLAGLQLGDNITQLSQTVQDLFARPQDYSTFQSGNYCSKTFVFNQYNTTTFRWCYYKSIDTTCSGTITNIYSGN